MPAPKKPTTPASFSKKAYRPIAMTPVQSNQIGAVGYDPATQTLACTFAGGPGHVYHYPGVDQKTFDAFMAAESKGTFFGKHIKARAFDKFPAPKQQK